MIFHLLRASKLSHEAQRSVQRVHFVGLGNEGSGLKCHSSAVDYLDLRAQLTDIF